MSKVLKSKQILSATLIIALSAAVAVNWYYRNNLTPEDDISISVEEVSGNLGDSLYVGATTMSQLTTDTTASAENTDKDYFSEAKLKRKQAHDKIIDESEKIINSGKLDNDTKVKISAMLSDFQYRIKSEADTENIITAKIAGECLVVINEGACQVILQKNTLNEHVILQITEIIEKNAKISAENLTIIELK